jgi:hypothetical protein
VKGRFWVQAGESELAERCTIEEEGRRESGSKRDINAELDFEAVAVSHDSLSDGCDGVVLLRAALSCCSCFQS